MNENPSRGDIQQGLFGILREKRLSGISFYNF